MEDQTMMKEEDLYYKKLQSLILLVTGNPFGRLGPEAPSRENFEKAFMTLKEIESTPSWGTFDAGSAGQIMSQVEAIVLKLRESRDPQGVAANFETRKRENERKLRFFATTANRDTNKAFFDGKMKEELLAEQDRLTSERAKYQAESMPALAMAKAQFQVYLFTLIVQRRYQHVIVAAKLYQSIIADGDLGMSQKNNPVAKVGKIDPDLPMTTTAAADLASKAQEDVRRGVEAYKNLTKEGQFDAADKTLQTAYMLGEMMPEIRSLPLASRKKILAVRQNRKLMTSALTVRDYAQAETKLKTLEQVAPDFDSSVVRMAIRKAKMESDAFLLKAKNAMFNGDQAGAESALREGTRIWPTNPRLDEKDKMAAEFDEQMKLKKELDDLLVRSDFRAVSERGEKFAAAVHDDSARQAKLREAIQHLSEMERALAKFEELEKTGSPYAAWEALDEVATKYPKDEKVALAYQEATVKAIDYIGGVRIARDNEKRGEQVAALSGYLWALSKNPGSEKIKLSVKNLSSSLLKDE